LVPVTTERTNAARLNAARLESIAIEAAEQCERLTIPDIAPLRPLQQLLAEWTDKRPLFVAMERDQTPPPPPVTGPKALLIGPEGGFGLRDRALLAQHGFARSISLGPTILRAETAAIVGLALLQAPGWG
jgi:16S rRNA (uracil1498-N3)-methyltransferase